MGGENGDDVHLTSSPGFDIEIISENILLLGKPTNNSGIEAGEWELNEPDRELNGSAPDLLFLVKKFTGLTSKKVSLDKFNN